MSVDKLSPEAIAALSVMAFLFGGQGDLPSVLESYIEAVACWASHVSGGKAKEIEAAAMQRGCRLGLPLREVRADGNNLWLRWRSGAPTSIVRFSRRYPPKASAYLGEDT